jgi:hypothetical protein
VILSSLLPLFSHEKGMISNFSKELLFYLVLNLSKRPLKYQSDYRRAQFYVPLPENYLFLPSLSMYLESNNFYFGGVSEFQVYFQDFE